MPGPFWWLDPMEYGFHRSKSTHRPSRLPIHVRISVRLRGTALGRGAWAGASAGDNAAAPAATAPAFMKSRRLSRLALLRCDMAFSSLPLPDLMWVPIEYCRLQERTPRSQVGSNRP